MRGNVESSFLMVNKQIIFIGWPSNHFQWLSSTQIQCYHHVIRVSIFWFFQPSNVWPPITRGRLENTWFNTKCGKGILFHSPLENYYVLELLNGASLSHIWDGNLSFKVINASFQVMKIHFPRGSKFLFWDKIFQNDRYNFLGKFER